MILISSLNLQYDESVSFFWQLLFLLTLLKFQTPLTLSSHNYGSKNDRIKNYHIFWTSRTSAFIWHPLIPLENFCIWVIGKNAKKYRFCPFSVSAPRNNVGGRHSDNFEGTGRAHSSFWRFLPILLREHIEIGVNLKIGRPRSLWSEIINICVRQKTLF